jgi:hypothetical protein
MAKGSKATGGGDKREMSWIKNDATASGEQNREHG